MPEATISFEPDAVFAHLATTVSDAFLEPPGIAAASLRNLLTSEMPAFPEIQRAMGYRKFVDFLLAAQEHHLVRVTRAGESFHPYVSPWDAPTADLAESSKAFVEGHRVRGTVWPALVDWDTKYARMWDRASNRAFMFPVVDGEPAWPQDPERFVTIEPVGPAIQFDWMRDFAATLPEEQCARLLSTVGEAAPRGAFRKELRMLHVERDWTATLQRRVAEYAREWSRKNDVPVSHLLELERPGVKRAQASKTTTRGGASSRAAFDPTRQGPTDELADALRAKLHNVIDQMSVSELSAISIPAAYLIQS